MAIVLTTVLLDQFSKSYIKSFLIEGESIPVIKDIFHITLVHNTGAAFGIFAGYTILFVVVTVIVILCFVIYYQRILEAPVLFQIGLAMAAGGAVGNLIDRLKTGAVVDFLDFRIWPVFNIADVGIVLGMGILIYMTIKWGRAEGEF
ncbi:MAG TPA: signal peptidase II [Clostridia bacterium]|nr:signal peptidase II [Clostridia bacterium]